MERHISIATASRLSGFPSVDHRRRAARAVVRVLGPACPLFCVADDHVHALVTALPERIPQLAGSLVQALRFVSEHPLAPAYVGEVRSRAHLRTLVPYVLDQTTHHGIVGAEHPALWEGS